MFQVGLAPRVHDGCLGTCLGRHGDGLAGPQIGGLRHISPIFTTNQCVDACRRRFMLVREALGKQDAAAVPVKCPLASLPPPTPRPRRPRLGPSRRRVGASARPPLGRLKRGVGRKTRASTTAAGSPARHFCPILRTLNWFSARRRTDLPELRLFVVSPNCQQSASWTAVRGKASMIRRASHSTAVGER
jgi:hypothetical protein